MLTFPSAPNHVRTRHKASASKRKSPFFGRQDSTQLTFPSAPFPPHVWHPTQGHGEQAKVNRLPPSQELNSTDFSQISQNPPRTLPVHDVILIAWSHFLSGIFILTSVNDTSFLRARQHLCSSVHLTNPYFRTYRQFNNVLCFVPGAF